MVLVQPYPEVTPAGSSVDGDKKTVTFNIVPKYNLIATHTGVTVRRLMPLDETKQCGAEKSTAVDGHHSCRGDADPAEGFAAAGADVYIKHEASNGKTYYYTAKVLATGRSPLLPAMVFSFYHFSTVNGRQLR